MKMPPARGTLALVAATSVISVFTLLSGAAARTDVLAGFIPARLSGAVEVPGALWAPLTPFTSALLHADLLHLGFNMLMLGFCGRFVEVALGRGGLITLYVIGAAASAGAEFLANPLGVVPVIGASGATSAVIGAYALLYGQQRHAGSPALNRALHVLWLAAAWIVLQLLIGIAGPRPSGGTIAIWSHIGGFLAGLALARPLLLWRYRRA